MCAKFALNIKRNWAKLIKLLFPLDITKNHRFSLYFRGNGSQIICLHLLNIRNKFWRISVSKIIATREEVIIITTVSPRISKTIPKILIIRGSMWMAPRKLHPRKIATLPLPRLRLGFWLGFGLGLKLLTTCHTWFLWFARI